MSGEIVLQTIRAMSDNSPGVCMQCGRKADRTELTRAVIFDPHVTQPSFESTPVGPICSDACRDALQVSMALKHA